MALDPSAARVAVVGVGGLGGALARGLLRSRLPASRITRCDVSAEKMGTVAGASGMRVTSDASEAARHADVVVVAVKPGDVAAAVDKVSVATTAEMVVVSAAAGVTLEALRLALGARGLLARAMPNVNVAVGASVTALCSEVGEGPEALAAAEWVFGHVGQTVRLPDEKLMDAATALAASGPAWLALVLEALMDGGVLAGLPRGVSVELALAMAQGTARHLLEGHVHPAALKDMVMSPGGTTAAGLEVLEARGVRGALMAAVEAGTQRARALRKT